VVVSSSVTRGVVVLRPSARRLIINLDCPVDHSTEIRDRLTIRVAKWCPSASSVVAPDPALFLVRRWLVASHSQTAPEGWREKMCQSRQFSFSLGFVSRNKMEARRAQETSLSSPMGQSISSLQGTGSGPTRLKHDLLHEGIDWEHVLKYEEKIDELKKKALVPLTYSVHAPLQLIPERVIDTTNRSLVREAQRDGFDPDGFKSGKPLQRDIFYLNPYITCSWYVSYPPLLSSLTVVAQVQCNELRGCAAGAEDDQHARGPQGPGQGRVSPSL
jgi:hypothetical protein